MSRITRLALLVAVAACSKKSAPAPASGGGSATVDKPMPPPATTAVKSDAPWQYDPAAVQAKLQGTWTVKDEGYLGSVATWTVTGDQVAIHDDKQNKDSNVTLGIIAPCALELVDKKPSGTETTTTHYVLDGDTLHMGLGNAGVVQGDKIVACMSNGVFVKDPAGCAFYYKTFDKWEKSPATCALEGDTFTASNETFKYQGVMTKHGAALADDQLWANTPARAK